MRLSFRAALLGCALFASLPVSAQTPPAAPPGMAPLPIGPGARPLSLDDAEAALVERNLTVIAARRGVDVARAQRLVASTLPAPTVTVGNSFAQFGETRNGALRGARYLSPAKNISVGLTVLVERGGKRTLRTRFAERQIEGAEAQVLDALRTQLFQLRQAFLGALLARANLEVALGNRASLDRTEQLLRRQLRDGAIPEGDLLRFQASRLQFEGDVTSNAQAYAAGVAAVAALLSADPALFQQGAGTLSSLGINPTVTGALAPSQGQQGRTGTPAGPASAPTAVRTILSPVAFDVRGRFDAIPDLGIGREELARGVASRPDVVAAERQAGAAAANRQLVEAGRSRDVTVDAGWSRSALSQDLPDSRDRLSALNSFGVQLSVPIFTSRIVEGNVAAATAQQGQADAVARATMLQARAEFAAAWAGVEQSRALLNLYAGGALGRAEEAYRSTEQAYVAGGRTLLDVLDALRVLNVTRVQANQARYSYLLALSQLEQASGVSGVAPRL